MSLSAPTTSTFARLFKQSKFSSFDPAISQVYTTHGGDARRGHWGFKRPLPLRRRGAYITVKSVDTPEYQTEWNSAEPQALWMKNWDELKVTPTHDGLVEDSGPEIIVDSDFVPPKDDPTRWRQTYLPNVEVMTRDEFKQYLKQVRARRGSFLHKQLSRQETDMTPYQLSNSHKSTPWHDAFAGHVSQMRRATPNNQTIEHMPHGSRGLTYAQYSPLQTLLMTKERKGRLTDEYRAKDRNMWFYLASFAGITGRVLKKHAGFVQPMVWEDPNNTGAAMLRPHKVFLEGWPSVVGLRQGLKAARISMELRVCSKQSHQRSNPHPPGSREYIAAEPPKTMQELTTSAVVGRAGRWRRRTYQDTTLSLLKSVVSGGGGS